MRAIWRTMLCATLAASVAACGSEDGTRSIAVQDAAGGAGGANLSLPADFPSDLPVYPQASVFATSPLPNQGYTLQAQAADPIEKVGDFYAAQMQANGWTDHSPAETSPAMRVLQYRKGTRTASIHLIPNGTGTTVQLQTYVG